MTRNQYFALRLLVRQYYDIQKLRVAYLLRLKDLVRRGILTAEQAEEEYKVPLKRLQIPEGILKRSIGKKIKDHPVAKWSDNVYGIGPCIAGGFIAEIGADRQVKVIFDEVDPHKWVTHPDRLPLPPKDTSKKEMTPMQKLKSAWVKDPESISIIDQRENIHCFENAGQLFAYAGLHVVEREGKKIAPKRRKGEIANWSGFLRTLAFKASDSFIKTGTYFRGVYDKAKAYYLRRGDCTKNHAHMRAKRIAAKLWVGLAWQVWREAEGLPARAPYAVEYLGHTTVITPMDVTG